VAGTLVLSAWEPEIAPLRRLARGIGRSKLMLATVGVGAVDAAAGAAAAIERARPTRVVFVGTAGVYWRGHATLPLRSVVMADRACLVSTAALRGDGYLPELLVTQVAASALPGTGVASGATVACPVAITRTATLGRQIAQATGAAVENLEAFAVLRAAARAGIKLTAVVLGVANRVGPRAHSEWKANHLAASRAACQIVIGIVKNSRKRYRVLT
jgi:nucleoside phosphorylase